jgi:hypothetical protein
VIRRFTQKEASMHRAFFNRSRIAHLLPLIALLTYACVPSLSAFGEEPPAKPRPKLVIRRTAALATAKDATAKTATANPDKVVAVPTHRQANKIEVSVAGQPEVKLSCFCLTPEDEILAGCTGAKGEIRVLGTDGKYLSSWSLPVNPDAIFCRADGAVFVAGDGQLIRLSSDGKVELAMESPHSIALKAHPEKLREEVIAQAKAQVKQFKQQSEMYDKMIERADKEISSITDQLSALDSSGEDTPNADGEQPASKKRTSPRRVASSKQSLTQRLAMYESQKEQYASAKEQYAKMIGATETGELSEQQIDERVKSSIEYKLKVASVSALNEDVFLATHAAAGYGFEILRMNDRFEDPVTIVKDLSGCCGQMDVKASKDGLFVAENSKHRVCHFDREGKQIGAWGEGARTGLDGFGSCCNPMNVAFGPSDAVYTSEDDTGRIKRYSADGKLLGLIGFVELKPGCKNVSIAVSKDGSRVYMLDITRNFIVQLDPRPADDVTADIEKMKNTPAAPPSGAGASAEPAGSTGTAAAVLRGLGALFSGN